MTRTYTELDYAVDEGIVTITLDRPQRLNASTAHMMGELLDAMDRADGDDAVRAILFTGRGRAFCAGADLGGGAATFELAGDDEFDMARHSDGGGIITRRLFASPKPLIGAINGPAIGVGASLTLALDMRLASDTARFGFVFTRRGLVPEAASSWFLPRIVGIAQATEWVLTGRIFDAQEALDGGLVRSVHPSEDLLPAARALAREIADNTSPVAVALARSMLWRMLGGDGPQIAHEVDSRGIFAMGRSADVREGVAAFLEKRPPTFGMTVSQDMPEFYEEWHAHGQRASFLPGP
jgi:enoyl-CoA hydratase/carnithine racemase